MSFFRGHFRIHECVAFPLPLMRGLPGKGRVLLQRYKVLCTSLHWLGLLQVQRSLRFPKPLWKAVPVPLEVDLVGARK